MKQMSFAAACKQYFGLHPEQTSVDFLKELQRLDAKDRKDLSEMFLTVGIEIK